MPLITLVDARDLDRWAKSRRAQEQLPALVRRLIHATTTTAAHIGIPAGDAVQQGGYDGVVVVNETHHVVPDGISVWELGVSANPKKKANEDYEKRKRDQPVSDVGPIDPAATTFVFVTPRRWTTKSKWAAERRAEGFWRDVRVIDADDLEAWLEQAPATHVWLSTELGHRPIGADDIYAVWRDWSEACTPPLSPALMFAGREKSRDEIAAWFTAVATAPTLGVESESPEETVAFVAAAIEMLPESERIAVLSRTVVVRDLDALVQMAASDEPLRIVTTFSPGDTAHRATRNGHRVLIPRSPGEGVAETLEIPRLNRAAAERELNAMGLAADRARELAGVARRSVMALRRHLATSATVSRPSWAAPDVGPAILPMLLLGTVNEGVRGDAEAIGVLSGDTPEEVFAGLTRLAAGTDPPVRRVGSVWYLVSKGDAWEALRRYMTRDVLERFVIVALRILGSPDPRYELPSDQRWAAALYNKERAYSGLLLRAVADTLALLGARGETVTIAPGVCAADYASRAVRQLLEEAGRDWQLWASLAPVLPSLAEAAPDVVLAAIETGLQSEEPSPVVGLFGHDVDSFSSSPHTALLWALERLAWSLEYLSSVARILAELARRDPGGRLANRPAESLRTIFCPWSPQTTASVEARLTVIDALRQREPDAAWSLMARLLPQRHDTNMVTGKPRWREWAADTPAPVALRVLQEHASEMVRRLLEDAGVSGGRWKTLIEALDDVPTEAHERILARLTALAKEPLEPETRATIWDTLREFLGKHRSFPDANWSLPPQQLDAIAAVFAQFEPEDAVARYRFLFSHHSIRPEGREKDFEQRHRLLEARRVDASRALYEALDIERIVDVSATFERSDAFGAALAETGAVPPADEPRLLLHALGHHEIRARVFGRAYLNRLQSSRGGEAIPAAVHDPTSEWPMAVRAEALIAMTPGPSTWRLVDALGEVGRTYYWQNVPVFPVGGGDVAHGMRELIRHERPHAAIDLAALHLREEPKPTPREVAHALLAAAPMPHDVTGYRSENYDISELLTFLEQAATGGHIAEEEVSHLELLYLPLLRHDRTPKLLHRRMAADPSLFVEAACLAYRGEHEAEQQLDNVDDTARAGLAYELLQSWRTPPGLHDNVIDGAQLKEWTAEARRRLAEADRVAIGDQLIGQVLSGSPAGADGAWPAEPIRDLVEELRNDDIEAGLRMGRFNQRGAVWRDPHAGGDEERSIKTRYEADATTIATKWPRTAAFLRSFAASYGRDARREDAEAELQHDLDL